MPFLKNCVPVPVRDAGCKSSLETVYPGLEKLQSRKLPKTGLKN